MQILGLILGLSLTWLSQAVPTEAGLQRSVHSRDSLDQPTTGPLPLMDVIQRGLQFLEAENKDAWLSTIICNPRDSFYGSSPSDFNLVYIDAFLPPPSTSITVANNGSDPLDFHVTNRDWYKDQAGGRYVGQQWRLPSPASWMTPDEAFDLVARQANVPPPYRLVSISKPYYDYWGTHNATEVLYKFESGGPSVMRMTVLVGTTSRRTLVLNQTIGAQFIDPPRRV